MLRHGSLFSGIGGFDLAAEWMGWENVFHCEYDPFCQKILKHHFPNSKLYKDVRTFDATSYFGRIDILSGGFPCQPFSNAGLRKGTEDDRHLWPQMLRIIREVSPRYVVGENVRGLINWSGGLVFEQVCADLENEGYEVTPYLLPACGKNAPHRRDRIWFVAYRSDGDAPDTESFRRKDALEDRELEGRRFRERDKPPTWDSFPSQPPICGGDDGLPKELDSITFPKWRNQSLKSYGNAIVPQIAHEIFKAIQKMEDLDIQEDLELDILTQAH